MKNIPMEKQKEIARNWRDMKGAYCKQLRLIAELAAHPDMKDEQLLEAARGLGRTYNMLREVRASLTELSNKTRLYVPIDLNLP